MVIALFYSGVDTGSWLKKNPNKVYVLPAPKEDMEDSC